MASTKTNKDEVSKKGAKTKDEETMDDQEEQPLPDGWARMFSRSKKKPYYFYVPTRKSQWQHPNSVKPKPAKESYSPKGSPSTDIFHEETALSPSSDSALVSRTSSTSSPAASSVTAVSPASSVSTVSPTSSVTSPETKTSKHECKTVEKEKLKRARETSPKMGNCSKKRRQSPQKDIKTSDASDTSDTNTRNNSLSSKVCLSKGNSSPPKAQKRNLQQESKSSKKTKVEECINPSVKRTHAEQNRKASPEHRKKLKARRSLERKETHTNVESQTAQENSSKGKSQSYSERFQQPASPNLNKDTCSSVKSPEDSKRPQNTNTKKETVKTSGSFKNSFVHVQGPRNTERSNINNNSHKTQMTFKKSQTSVAKSLHTRGVGPALESLRASYSQQAIGTKRAYVEEEEEEEEEMDTEQYTEQILAVRSSLSAVTEEATGQLTQRLIDSPMQNSGFDKDTTTTKMYIVIDSNVLIDHLSYITDLRDRSIPGYGPPVLVIPWMVLQELDAIKHDRGKKLQDSQLQQKARKAIHYLNESIESKHPRLQAESMQQKKIQIEGLEILCNDDWLIHCCFLWKNRYPDSTVLLLSHDINLRSKTVVNGIAAFGIKRFQDTYMSGEAKSNASKLLSSVTPNQKRPALSSTFTPIQDTTSNGSVQKRRSPILDLDRPTSPVQRCVSPLNRTDSPQIDNAGLISAGTSSPVIKPSTGSPYVTQNMPPNKTSYSHQMTPASPYVTRNMMPNMLPQSRQVATVPPLHQKNPVTPNITAQIRQTAQRQQMTPTGPRMISSTISTSPADDTMMISSEYTSKCSTSSVTTLDDIVKATTQKQVTRDPVSSRPAPPPAAVKPRESHEKAVARVCDEMLCDVKTTLVDVLSPFLKQEMMKVYGEIWLTIVYRKPPWTLLDILESINKHWIAVFGMLMNRDAQKHVQALLNTFKAQSGSGITSKQMEDILIASQDVCSHLPSSDSISPQKAKKEFRTCLQILNDLRNDKLKPTTLADLKNQKQPSNQKTSTPTPTHPPPKQTSQQPPPPPALSLALSPALSPAPSPIQVTNMQGTNGDGIEGNVLRAFQLVWNAILFHRDSIAQKLANGEPESKNYLTQLCIILALLHHHYSSLLEVDPSSLVHHIQKLVLVTKCLDHCALKFEIEDWRSLTMEELGTFYQQPGKREVLNTGLGQLMDIAKSLIDYQQQYLSQEEIHQLQQACNEAVSSSHS